MSDWPALRVYFAITVILSLIGWTDLARVVRGRFLSLREEDFVLAARLYGAGKLRIILRHMVPSFTSHIIASLTLSLPAMILSETALSFLGLGLRPPIVSWGVLLKDTGPNTARSEQFADFQSDAPACDNCGAITVRNGNCYLCHNCGSSMGCS